MKSGRLFILIGLAGVLAYLTLTKSGRGIAQKIGSGIMDLSQAGIDAIARIEGFSPTPYPDARGQSIGYGHFILPGESFSIITEEQGRALLALDTAKANAAVLDLVKVPLTQSQHDALVSFAFNVGINALKNSTLLRLLNAGDYAGASAQFPVWNKSHAPDGSIITVAALTDRRMSEQAMFNA